MSTQEPGGPMYQPTMPDPVPGPGGGLFVDVEPAISEDEAGRRWHPGLDVGLLLVRVVLGVTMVAHGLQKLGLFDGPGINGFAKVLEDDFGFTSQTTVLSWITTATEIGGGVMIVIGLFTPLGAAGVLGLTASVVVLKAGNGFFVADGGFEFELMLCGAALGVLFAGPGRIALDANTPWRRNTMPFGVAGLVLAAAAAVTVLVVFR